MFILKIVIIIYLKMYVRFLNMMKKMLEYYLVRRAYLQTGNGSPAGGTMIHQGIIAHTFYYLFWYTARHL